MRPHDTREVRPATIAVHAISADLGAPRVDATDEWGRGLPALVLEDNVILDPEEAGVYLNAANHGWLNVSLSHLTVVGAREVAIEAGGGAGIDGTIDDVVLASSSVGLDAWSPMGFELGRCTVHGNDVAGDREFASLPKGCVDADPGFGDLGVPVGPDGRFFTADPWVSASGGARPD